MTVVSHGSFKRGTVEIAINKTQKWRAFMQMREVLGAKIIMRIRLWLHFLSKKKSTQVIEKGINLKCPMGLFFMTHWFWLKSEAKETVRNSREDKVVWIKWPRERAGFVFSATRVSILLPVTDKMKDCYRLCQGGGNTLEKDFCVWKRVKFILISTKTAQSIWNNLWEIDRSHDTWVTV